MNYTQQDRAMEVTTPLGKDKLLLIGFTGQESISRLFSFHLDLIAENSTDVAFDKLLGQKITIRLDLLDEKNAISTVFATALARASETKFSPVTGWKSCRSYGCSRKERRAGSFNRCPCPTFS